MDNSIEYLVTAMLTGLVFFAGYYARKVQNDLNVVFSLPRKEQ